MDVYDPDEEIKKGTQDDISNLLAFFFFVFAIALGLIAIISCGHLALYIYELIF